MMLLGLFFRSNDPDTYIRYKRQWFHWYHSRCGVGQFTKLLKDCRYACRKWCRTEPGNNSINLLQTNVTNLEAAHGRIMDADIALESTRFARQNVLVQASASMTAQANQLTNIALTLLQ